MIPKASAARLVLSTAGIDRDLPLAYKGLLLTIIEISPTETQVNGSLKISAIAEHAGISTRKATRIVKKLIDKGYISEPPQKEIKLTEIRAFEQSWMQ